MSRFRLLPVLALAALMALTAMAPVAVKAPASAGELDADTYLGDWSTEFRSDDPAKRFLAGVAACIWLADDAERLIAHVEGFGWQRGDYGGLTELARGDSRLLVAAEAGFCDIAVYGLGLADAGRHLAAFIAEVAAFDDEAPHLWSLVTGPGDCASGRFPGGRFRLQSDGQDPVCEGAGGASVRVLYGAEGDPEPDRVQRPRTR